MSGYVPLQWGHGTKTVENHELPQIAMLRTTLRFNGATAQRPWRTRRLHADAG